jgi:hypothetical protein
LSWAKRLVDDPQSRKELFKGIRNKRFLDLCALCFACYYDDHREIALSLRKRVYAKGGFPNHSGIAYELQPSDVIAVLGPSCSERRAKEYIRVLQVIALEN